MNPRPQAGVTLIEMMVVVALIGLMAAISFPSVSSGLDSIRLVSAADSIGAFLNSGLNRAERRQQPVEITISPRDHTLTMRSTDPGFVRTLGMPEGVTIAAVHPALPPGIDEPSQTFLVYPAGAIPRIGIEIANRRGARRIVRIDPTTGVPAIEQVQ